MNTPEERKFLVESPHLTFLHVHPFLPSLLVLSLPCIKSFPFRLSFFSRFPVMLLSFILTGMKSNVKSGKRFLTLSPHHTLDSNERMEQNTGTTFKLEGRESGMRKSSKERIREKRNEKE